MTGPDHYLMAERHLRSHGEMDLQKAMVHAVLALAAATAIRGENTDDPDFRAWAAAASEARKQPG